MPMGHLMLGFVGGLLATVAALVVGLPVWLAVLLYSGAGSLCFVAGVLGEELLRRMRRPSRPVRRRAVPLGHVAARPVQVRVRNGDGRRGRSPAPVRF